MTSTHLHQRYKGRTVEWGHWGLTFMERQPDLSKNYGVIVASMAFPVGARGPMDALPGQRERLNAIVDAWVVRGELPLSAATTA